MRGYDDIRAYCALAVRFYRFVGEEAIELKLMRYERFFFLTDKEWERLLWNLTSDNVLPYALSDGALFYQKKINDTEYLVPTDICKDYRDCYVELSNLSEQEIKSITEQVYETIKENSDSIFSFVYLDAALDLYPLIEWKPQIMKLRDNMIQELNSYGERFNMYLADDINYTLKSLLADRKEGKGVLGSPIVSYKSKTDQKLLYDIIYNRYWNRLYIQHINEIVHSNLEELKKKFTNNDTFLKEKYKSLSNDADNLGKPSPLNNSLTETQIKALYEALKGKYIASSTFLEQFQELFDSGVTKMVTPIEWLGDTRLLVYFLDSIFVKRGWPKKIESKEAFPNNDGGTITAQNIYTSLSQMSKTGSPKGSDKIDTIIDSIRKQNV